jgi:chemotaxis protein MotB
MRKKLLMPLVLMVMLTACETPWYKAQKENDALRAENQRLMAERNGFDDMIFKSQAERDAAVANYQALKRKQNNTVADLKRKFANTGASITLVDGRPAIVLPSGVFFNSGKHTLNTGGKNTLKKVANLLNSQYSKFVVSVQGHTDSDPIRRSKYADNYQLSAERAREVLNYLSKSGGIKNSRLQGAFYGPNKPVSSNKTAPGKKKNRRVELVLIG